MEESQYIGRFWKRLPDNRVECDLCPRRCQLSPNQRGFCFVRMGTPEGVALTTYGRSSGFCIDPIEKKPLNHFFPGSSVLSFGTAGCNLGCRFCQNWDISKAKAFDRLQNAATPSEIAASAQENGCQSVSFTYNDPVIFAEYAIDTAKECKKLGLKTVAVTAGYITEEARGEFFDHMDAANIDLKAFTEKFYQKDCLSHLDPVLDTIEYVAKRGDVWLEVTTLLIPGRNDSSEELERLIDWYVKNLGKEIPLHFTAFHPDFRMQDVPSTPFSTLERARQMALDAGLHYVYTGNVRDLEGGTTFCPGCKKAVIVRSGYDLQSFQIRDGACSHCGVKIAGHFNETAGSWGSKRRMVAP